MSGRLTCLGVPALWVALVGCGPSVKPTSELPVQPTSDRIVIYDYKFNPPRLTVPVGTKVTWVNMDLIHHTATSNLMQTEPFNSRNMLYKGEYSHTFSRPGEYPYICVPHPGMKGTIVVE